MSGPRGFQTPSHLLYADDILVLCKGTKRNLRTLINFFKEYGDISGQLLGLDKCKFYSSALTPSRSAAISQILGFGPGVFPFFYLSIPFFKGKPRVVHLKPIADRIRAKLSTWKGSLLSIMGRVQLVNSVITGMLSYSFHVYHWPAALLKTMDGWIRNFVWLGDVDTRKIITVARKTVCSPTCDGGLGLKSIASINKAAVLKLSWEILYLDSQWSSFLRFGFIRNNVPVTYHIRSSIIPAIKYHLTAIKDNTTWILGDGRSINF